MIVEKQIGVGRPKTTTKNGDGEKIRPRISQRGMCCDGYVHPEKDMTFDFVAVNPRLDGRIDVYFSSLAGRCESNNVDRMSEICCPVAIESQGANIRYRTAVRAKLLLLPDIGFW